MNRFLLTAGLVLFTGFNQEALAAEPRGLDAEMRQTVEKAKIQLARVATLLDTTPEQTFAQILPKAESQLRDQKRWFEANVVHSLSSPLNRQMFRDRARALVNDNSQNGIFLLLDLVMPYVVGGDAVFGHACLGDDANAIWCILYWAVVVATFDGEPVGLN